MQQKYNKTQKLNYLLFDQNCKQNHQKLRNKITTYVSKCFFKIAIKLKQLIGKKHHVY